jgi:hypothetical protein
MFWQKRLRFSWALAPPAAAATPGPSPPPVDAEATVTSAVSLEGWTMTSKSFLRSRRGSSSSSVKVSPVYFDGFWMNCRMSAPERSFCTSCSREATVQASSIHWKRLASNDGLAGVARAETSQVLLQAPEQALTVLAELVEDARGVAVFELTSSSEQVLDGDLVAARVHRAHRRRREGALGGRGESTDDGPSVQRAVPCERLPPSVGGLRRRSVLAGVAAEDEFMTARARSPGSRGRR